MGSEDDVRALSAAWDQALVANDPERVASFIIDTGSTPAPMA
jgi:hypothetical protein